MSDTKTKVAFGSDPNTIIVLSYEGNYYYASFDSVQGGNAVK